MSTQSEADDSSTDTTSSGGLADLTLSANAAELGQLTSTLRALEPVEDEAMFRFAEDGLQAEVVEPAENAMAVCRAPPAAFEEYETSGFDAGIPLDTLDTLLGKVDDSTVITLSFSESNRIEVLADGEHLYEFAPIGPEMVRTHEIPDVDEVHTHVCQLSTPALKDAKQIADMASDSAALMIEWDQQGGHTGLWAEGDTDRATPPIENLDVVAREESPKPGCSADAGARVILSISYWSKFLSAVPTSKGSEVRVRASTDMPLVTRWAEPSVADSSELFEYELFFAPRIPGND